MNRKLYVRYNINSRSPFEGLLKVTGSHIHVTSVNILIILFYLLMDAESIVLN